VRLTATVVFPAPPLRDITASVFMKTRQQTPQRVSPTAFMHNLSTGGSGLVHSGTSRRTAQVVGSTSSTLATPTPFSAEISSSTVAATSAASRPRSTKLEPKPLSPKNG